MTLEQKIGQFFFPAVFINDSEDSYINIENLITKHHIGGLTFFHSRASAATNYESNVKVQQNDDSFSRLKALIIRFQKCSQIPLLMSIDAEWGLAMRIENTPQYPYAISIGALPEQYEYLAYEVGKRIGLDLKSAGINYNLAPLGDINNNHENPVIGHRSFGQNAERVSRFAIQYLKGQSEVGVIGCLKHFPGHGNTNVDSHLGLPILSESVEELFKNELVPFIKCIENDVDSIMIGHLAVPSLNGGEQKSATLSKSVIEGLLRNKLGFNGLVISDALNMRSVCDLYPTKGQLEWEAFNAGNDVLCFAENIVEGIQEIIQKASSERIEASFSRIMKCKEKAGLFRDALQTSQNFDFESTSLLNRLIADKSILKIKDENCSLQLFEAKNDNKLAKLSFYKGIDNVFFKSLQLVLPSDQFAIETAEEKSIEIIKEVLDNYDFVLIAFFIPKVKPAQNYGINENVLNFLAQLLKTKKCVLYLFGNPYAISRIYGLELAIGICQVYQDFTEYQESAAQQLIKNSDCQGESPIEISLF